MAIFTWWNGATLGTALFTRLRGLEVGRDELGNLYYQHRKDGRRWVVYSGSNDGARVPPEWQEWLRGTIDDLPDKVLPPRRSFEKPAVSDSADEAGGYRPSGSLLRGHRRPASTGDYQPWMPD